MNEQQTKIEKILKKIEKIESIEKASEQRKAIIKLMRGVEKSENLYDKKYVQLLLRDVLYSGLTLTEVKRHLKVLSLCYK